MPNYRITATRLPRGGRPETWWIADGIWHDQPVPDAIDLPGAFAIGGLVDAHTHLSMDFGLHGHADASLDCISTNLDMKARQGVLAVRDPGVLPCARVPFVHDGRVRVIACGNMHAPAGRFWPGKNKPTPPDQLIARALTEIDRGAHWVKIIADFPGEDMNFWAPIDNYAPELVRELCAAVHARGARVAAHASGPIAGALVRAGLDAIEHGPHLTEDDLRVMADTGAAWTPTLTTIGFYTDMVTQMGAPVAAYARANRAHVGRMLTLAERLRVTIMAGTDERPADLVAEVQQLHALGLSVTAALDAASDGARAWLGFSGWRAGERADVALYAADPRNDLSELARPLAVLSAGEWLAPAGR